ncbi:MAG: hypothetical protein KGI08_10885 [Thaumarchaeota archaeon]|nr:hypothetical protein [Nitrososphaerota archaeon]
MISNKEYRLEIKVKNNLIMSKIESLGFDTIAAFCRKHGFRQGCLGDLVNMKMNPINKEGKFFDWIYRLCDVFACSIEDLFTEDQLQTILETNRFIAKVSKAEMQFMLNQTKKQLSCEEQYVLEKLPQDVAGLLDTLTPREKRIIQMRFGLDGEKAKTAREVAQEFDVSPVRIQQIEGKALRKLRHPSRRASVQDYMETFLNDN